MKVNIVHVLLFGGGAILIYCGIKDVSPLDLLNAEPPVKPGGGTRKFKTPPPGFPGSKGGGGSRDLRPGSGGGGVRPV